MRAICCCVASVILAACASTIHLRPPLNEEQVARLRKETENKPLVFASEISGPELALSEFFPASDAAHGMTSEGPRTIPLRELASLRWRNSWSGAKAGMLIGVLGGAAAGALIANANCHTPDETGVCNSGVVQGFGAGVGAFIGLALGLVVGAAIGADDRVEFDRPPGSKPSD